MDAPRAVNTSNRSRKDRVREALACREDAVAYISSVTGWPIERIGLHPNEAILAAEDIIKHRDWAAQTSSDMEDCHVERLKIARRIILGPDWIGERCRENGLGRWTESALSEWTVGEFLEVLVRFGNIVDGDGAAGMMRESLADVFDRLGRLERIVPSDLPEKLKEQKAPANLDTAEVAGLRREVKALRIVVERLTAKEVTIRSRFDPP